MPDHRRTQPGGCTMNAVEHGAHGHGRHHHGAKHGHHHGPPQAVIVDPVCGMRVDPVSALSHRLSDETYHFCSAGCRDKFIADAARYLPRSPEAQIQTPVPGTLWTCPMHPEIRRDEPGACPICGMALEPLAPSA